MIAAKNTRLQHLGPDISSWAALVLPQPVLQSSVPAQNKSSCPNWIRILFFFRARVSPALSW
jgi:hypothetical protein